MKWNDCLCDCETRDSDLLHLDITYDEYQNLSGAEQKSNVIFFVTDIESITIDSIDNVREIKLESTTENPKTQTYLITFKDYTTRKVTVTFTEDEEV